MGYWKLTREIEWLARPPGQTETQAAINTNAQIRDAISRDELVNHFDLDVFLQGSYANSTNVSGSSDIDVVSKMSNTYYHNFFDKIPPETREAVKGLMTPATVGWNEYRNLLLQALRRQFPNAVEDGNKAITVKGTQSGSRLNADVVPCCAFRMFRDSQYDYEEGICLWNTATNEQIINFPKQHRVNMSAKNGADRAGPKFKGIIRSVKRLRNELDTEGTGLVKEAASYWIECLLYNAPDSLFLGSFDDAFTNSLSYLFRKLETDESDDFMQPNEVYILFHGSQWSKNKAIRLVDSVWRHAFEWIPA